MVNNCKKRIKAKCKDCGETTAYMIDLAWFCNKCHKRIEDDINKQDEICRHDGKPCTEDDCPYIYDC